MTSAWYALSSNSGSSNVTEKVLSGVSVKFLISAVTTVESRPPLR